MSLSKEAAYKKAKEALEKAQRAYDKAYAAWQDELDVMILKPIHERTLSRNEAVKLAKLLDSDELFEQIMKMGELPTITTYGKKEKEKNEAY